jgi:hypothetical protein
MSQRRKIHLKNMIMGRAWVSVKVGTLELSVTRPTIELTYTPQGWIDVEEPPIPWFAAKQLYVVNDPNGVSSGFGKGCDMDGPGNLIVVGNPLYSSSSGILTTYLRSSTSNTLTLGASFRAATNTNILQGTSIALSMDGQFLFQGAPNFGAAFAGRTYATQLNPATGNLATSAVWTFLNVADFSCAGLACLSGTAIACTSGGDFLVSSAPGSTASGTYGRVITYSVSGTTTRTFTMQQIISPYTAVTNAGFGNSLAMSKDGLVLAVGKPNENVGGNSNAGAVYVYVRSSLGTSFDTTSTGTQLLTPYSVTAQTGASVSLDAAGTILVIGHPSWSQLGGNTNGLVSIYVQHSLTGLFVLQQVFGVNPYGAPTTNYMTGIAVISGNGKTVYLSSPADTSNAGGTFKILTNEWASDRLQFYSKKFDYESFGNSGGSNSGQSFGQTCLATSTNGGVMIGGSPSDSSGGALYLWG